MVFLGVGEAFDETLPNTSILVRCGLGASRVTVLLDCGFTAPPQFWRAEPSADALDAVWICTFTEITLWAFLPCWFASGRKDERSL